MFKSIFMTIIVYLSLVVILRVSGKRTLAKLNAFDLVVTITIGSIAATTILSKDTSYFQGISIITILVILQFIIAKVTIFSEKFNELVKSEPTLLFYKGVYIKENLKKTRITKNDILQEARLSKGITSNRMQAVILERNGELSVITDSEDLDEEELKHYI